MLPARIGCLPQYTLAAPGTIPDDCIADNFYALATDEPAWVRDLTGNLTTVSLSADAKTIRDGLVGHTAVFSNASHASGKWYAEVLLGGASFANGNPFGPGIGLWPYYGLSNAAATYIGNDGHAYFGVTQLLSGLTNFAAGQVVMIAFDATTGSIWLGRDGVWNSGDPAAGTGALKTGLAGVSHVVGTAYTAGTSKDYLLTLRGKLIEFSFPPPAGFSAWSGPASGTALMLHADGPDGAAIFSDSSSFARAVTAFGTAVTRTLQHKFGTAALNVLGAVAGDYVAVAPAPELDWMGRPGTLELWLFWSASGTNRGIVGDVGGVSGIELTVTAAGLLKISAVGNGGSLLFPGGVAMTITTLAVGVWTHIAIDKLGAWWFIFVNGVLTVTVATPGFAKPNIGGLIVGSQQLAQVGFNGYIDEFRLTVGYARHVVYSGAPWPDTIGGDPSFASVVMLLHGDSSFVDSSTFAHTTSGNVGVPVISGAQTKYGAGSMLFNGSNNIAYAHAAEFDVGAGDFTVEFWFYETDTAQDEKYICGYAAGATAATFAWWIKVNLGGGLLATWSDGAVTHQITIAYASSNEWHHVAFFRVGNVFTLCLDGRPTSATTAITVTNPAAATLTIGGVPSVATNHYFGHVEEFRFTKGLSRYSALQATNGFVPEYRGVAFTPDVLPFCNVAPGSGAVTPGQITAVGATTTLLLATSGIASVGAAPVPSVDFVDHTPACYENAGTMTVVLQLTSPYAIAPCSLHWATSDGNAIAGTDYTASSGTANFTDSSRTAALVIPVTDNAIYAAGAAKTFTITLSAPAGCTITTASVPARIIDNDAGPAHTVKLTSPGVQADSIIFKTNGDLGTLFGGPAFPALEWLTDKPQVGAGAGFDVRGTFLSGDAMAGTYGVWLNLAADRTFGTFVGASPGAGFFQAWVKFEIRDSATGVVQQTASYYFQVVI